MSVGMKLTLDQVAQLCHNANRDLCWILGDYSQPPFDEAPDWQRQSALNGVSFRLRNPDVTSEQMHINWMKQKTEEGWVYGPVKDPDRKMHPCMVEYSQLGPEQQLKDYLFGSIVDGIRKAGMTPDLT